VNEPTVNMLFATCPLCDRPQHVACRDGQWRMEPHRGYVRRGDSYVEVDCDVAGLDALPLIRAWLVRSAALPVRDVEIARRDVGKAMAELARAERNAAYARATHPQLAALVPPEEQRPTLSPGQREALAALAHAEDVCPAEIIAPELPPMAAEDLARLKALGLVERSLLGDDSTTFFGRAWLASEAGSPPAEVPRDDHRHRARAVVAFGPGRTASFVFYEGRVLAETIEVGWELDPREVLPRESIARFLEGAVGVVLWEGEYRWAAPGWEETHGEWEISGSCRPLTAEEWAAVGVGRAPWAPAGA